MKETKNRTETSSQSAFATMKPFTGYTVRISTEPSYYGSSCTEVDADNIYNSLATLITGQFPGVTIEPHDGRGSSKTTGPDEAACDEIDNWIALNWTKAL